MKNLFYLIINGLLLFISSMAYSQHAPTKPQRYFIEADGGVQFSRLHFIGRVGDFLPGSNIELNGGYYLKRNLYLTTGFGVISKGFQNAISITTSPESPIYHKIKTTLNYVSFPVGMGVEFGNRIKVYAQQSVRFNYLFDAHTRVTPKATFDFFPYNEDLALFNRFETALNTAVGVKIPFGSYYLGIDFNAHMGLTTIIHPINFENSLNEKNTYPKILNYGFGSLLKIGYRF